MGKAVLIGTVAMMFLSTMMIMNSQQVNRETDRRQYDHMHERVAREMALSGRKLVLAHWAETSGTSAVAPFSSISLEGGTLTVADYALNGSELDFTLRAEFEDATHEIRSRYRWNSYGINPLQIKATDLHMDISPWANLDIGSITLDDQSISELDQLLIQELQLGESLEEFDLSIEQMQNELETKLGAAGFGDIPVAVINDVLRDQLDTEDGIFFPDQVTQAIASFMADNPEALQTVNLNTIANAAVELVNPTKEVYKVEGNLMLSHDFSGEGILIVQGNLVVPEGIAFAWEGLVVVQPPSSNLHAQIDFQGDVNLTGSLIALQEAVPNTGHMDVTIFKDMSGTWATPYGNEHMQSNWGWNWSTFHTHDYTAIHGNWVRFYSSSGPERIHENRIHFNSTLNQIGASTPIFLEIFNESAHGRASLTMEVDGQPRVSKPVAPGFDGEYVAAGNHYRTQTFPASDLEYLQVDVSRLSALKKMWDDSDNPFPNCTLDGGVSGPLCVGQDYNRQGALTLRLYTVEDFVDKLVYETSLYWHRREDEEEEFEENMNDLVENLQSTDTGLTINFGDNVNFVSDSNVIASLGAFGGLPLGVSHLGTWHTRVEPAY